MLTEAEAIDYLLQHQLLTAADIVRNGLIVEDVSRRNRNYTVRVDNGAGYFLKQSDIRQSRKTLHREAEYYHLLWMKATDFASRHMPRLRWFDPTEELLVLDYLESVQPVNTAPSADSKLPMTCAAELGRALARLHDAAPVTDPALEVPAPWIFSVYKPGPELLADLSSAAILAIKIVQQTAGFGDLLINLSRTRERPTLTHGDVRWDNCLVRTQTGVGDIEQLFIVDWELGGLGDPCWDVAGVFCEYLNSWVRSLPVMSSLSLENSLDLAARPLDAIQPGMAAFWRSYREERSTASGSQAVLLRSVQLAGARLVQSAIESAQASAQLTSTIVYTLQLAENIVRDPRRAALQLLRLPVG
jgi:hypothetical protein